MSSKSQIKTQEQEAPYFMFTKPEDLSRALGNIESYQGIVRNPSERSFLSTTASRRSYIDIEPNISVRTDFSKNDYYRFRPLEQPGTQHLQSMAMSMNAYDKVGIIKNVIDLMGDFGSQGISLNHENKSIERFYRRWWHKVGGVERSERFLNNLYRCGNVVIYRRYAKLTATMRKQMTRSADIVVPEKQAVITKHIPVVYDFLNPMTIDVVGGQAAAFAGRKRYKMRISRNVLRQMRADKSLAGQLPDYLRRAIEGDKPEVELSQDDIRVFHYKKDDWSLWANPLVNPILDDIIMLEKMKLADMSALDGAISSIRLWRLGNLEHKILPSKGSINKLRDVLAANTGGGTMDLVWGPEIDFKESASQVYKFLGSEKYEPVLNSIYAGLGIPPTLTGIAGQSGGYTNNFISLKTLIDRLEYGRSLLNQFWQAEIEYIQKAMGFAKPATIHYDHMMLSDETAEKNLLVRLAEEDIISIETLRERIGEDNAIEEKRITQERKKRESGKIPPKASPYHNANMESEYKKLALQRGEISITDVVDIVPTAPKIHNQEGSGNPNETKKVSPTPEGGRPKFQKDQEKRKRKEVKPKTAPTTTAEVIIWSQEAQRTISNLINPAILAQYGKTDLRSLTRSELTQLENIKFRVLCSLNPFEHINEQRVFDILNSGARIDSSFTELKASTVASFLERNGRQPTVEDIRSINSTAYAFIVLS